MQPHQSSDSHDKPREQDSASQQGVTARVVITSDVQPLVQDSASSNSGFTSFQSSRGRGREHISAPQRGRTRGGPRGGLARGDVDRYPHQYEDQTAPVMQDDPAIVSAVRQMSMQVMPIDLSC